jgi:hypothetical protein
MVAGSFVKLRFKLAGLVFATLSACAAQAPIEPTLKPVPRPAPVAPPPPVVAQPVSQKSAALRSYFNQVQQAQLGQGLLRRDGGGADTPFTADMLVRNFEQIAFYNEYNANFTGHGDKTLMRRWEQPVRMEIVFGDGVPPSERETDTAAVRAYAGKLANLTGHPVSVGSGAPNFMIIFANEDDRGAALVEAAKRVPGITPASLTALRDLRRDTYCIVAAYAGGADPSTYTAAVAVIRSENPSLMRLSCIHEELAQGLGLANDSPAARPSIFNDDDEFALLTRHDELLLKMLYDPRLQAGISAEDAMPIARTIAFELTGGPV